MYSVFFISLADCGGCVVSFCDAAHRGHSTMRKSVPLWSLLKEGHKWVASQWNSTLLLLWRREVDTRIQVVLMSVCVLWFLCMNGENVCAHAGGTSKTDWTNSDAPFEWRDSEDRATGLTNSLVVVGTFVCALLSSPSLFLFLFRRPPSPS